MLKKYDSSFAIFFSSIGIGTLMSVILYIPIALIVNYTAALINFFTDICGTIITLFILSYKDGYRTHNFKFIETLVIQVMVLITQILLVLIFGHAVYFSGPTVYLSRFILNVFNQGAINAKAILENYRWIFMLVAYIVVYAPIMTLGKYLGARRRKKDFNRQEEN